MDPAALTVAPSAHDLLFAIGEQANALMGLALCLTCFWNRLHNPRRICAIIMPTATAWFVCCGIVCATFRLPTQATIIPTAFIVIFALRRLTGLTLAKTMFVCASAAYVVAIIFYLSMVLDVAALGTQSNDLRVGWPGLAGQLLMDAIAPFPLRRPMRTVIPHMLNSNTADSRFWNLVWLLPFVSTSVVIWCFPIDTTILLNGRMLEIACIVSVVYSCFMVMSYVLLWMLIRQTERLIIAAEHEHNLTMQTLQLSHMNDRIREARQVKHNLRQHIQTLQVLADTGDLKGLRNYLDQMSKHNFTSSDNPMQYCEHVALNAVLVYYCDRARRLGVTVDVKAAVPARIGINNADLCAIVGNLMENAVEALQSQDSQERWLKVRIRLDDWNQRTLFITVDNSYGNAITRNDGHFISTKHDGEGVGTASICNIAQRNHGTASFEYDDSTFQASVMLDAGLSESGNP